MRIQDKQNKCTGIMPWTQLALFEPAAIQIAAKWQKISSACLNILQQLTAVPVLWLKIS